MRPGGPQIARPATTAPGSSTAIRDVMVNGTVLASIHEYTASTAVTARRHHGHRRRGVLDDLAPFDHEHAVRDLHCGQAVRDDQRGAPGQDGAQRLLHEPLAGN